MPNNTNQALQGTDLLTFDGDLAAQMVEALDGYVMDAVASAVEKRETLWHRDYSSRNAYAESIEPNRERLKKQIGCFDERLPIEALSYVASTKDGTHIAEDVNYTVSRVRWQVFDEVEGEGLLLEPTHNVPMIAQVVALPDADWTPEMIAGVTDELPPNAQFARRLAKAGCRVVVPLLINRDDTYSGNPTIGAMTNQPHREFIYRMAYQLGRHIIGYEVQKVLSLVDWMSLSEMPIGVIGYGEGGLIAFHSAAVDTRIQATAVSGYFESRQAVWREPIYRNVWGLLHEFGDAEIASLIAPRPLIVEASRGPEVTGPPPVRDGRGGAAPGQLVSPPLDSVKSEFNRAHGVYHQLDSEDALCLVSTEDRLPGSQETLTTLLTGLGVENARPDGDQSSTPAAVNDFDIEARQKRQFMQLVNLTQRFLRAAASQRQQFFWEKTDTTSLARWEETCTDPRAYFWDEVIGKCPPPDVPANPRTRLIYDEPRWKGYEVVLDVWDGVFAYGILLLPNDLQPGEQRPVVVCQHGLEGRPQDTADPKIESVYHAYAASLADRGFITYAPQNPYIGQDAFRVIQRKGNPIKWSLFSLIIRQHEQTLEWLAEQPFVDPDRIGFYGLSYGGKTAMRVPAVLERYACSICSADFNEWIVKNATYDSRYSYMFTGEYEMPEFDLGNTFNYGEMAGLIAPRPFMVERGHDDGVAPDEWVAHEFAVVRRLYVRLGVADRTEIEFFDGGHQINSTDTFSFLHRHLNWPEPASLTDN
ncbi:prolyl oligopeptidase family serine peptidase [Candidatus Poribacteria bacterium]|nr:prolyl oligopeptidase family serine peptidase [Candidatus Poribacteria bacterium]